MLLVNMVIMDTDLSEFRKCKGHFYKETSDLKGGGKTSSPNCTLIMCFD